MKRPRGPSLTAALRTVDGFHLTFSQGACCVCHPLRWYFFLTGARWQAAMLRACDSVAELLRAPDGVVMSDSHPAYGAFLVDKGNEACQRAAPPAEGEVTRVADLYRVLDAEGTWNSHGYWRFRRDGLPVMNDDG